MQIFVDGTLLGDAPVNVERPDVVAVYPNAPLQCGWTFTFDSTLLTNGHHTVTVKATDSTGNVAIFAPIPITINN